MKVFLSWSGQESKKLALSLHEFLKRLGLDPWFSEADLRAGDEWPATTFKALKGSQVCIACVTDESLRSGWMHYEAAAVPVRIPLCWKGSERSLSGPLSLTQAVIFGRDSVFKLVSDLNRRRDPRLSDEELQQAFDEHWPRLAAFDEDPLERLLTLRDAVKAPYLLAQAAAMRRERQNDAREQQALRELVREMDNLLPQSIYLPKAQELIRENHVWAICGNKTERAWDAFLEANEYSQTEGGRQIERIFLPPEPEEKDLIRRVIKRHFKHSMRVRVFPGTMSAQMVYGQWNLPIGFGMTVIGKAKAGKDDPDIVAVLIHWGGFGKDPRPARYGVILRQYAWKEHFWKSYREIARSTKLVQEKDLYGPKKRDEFKEYW